MAAEAPPPNILRTLGIGAAIGTYMGLGLAYFDTFPLWQGHAIAGLLSAAIATLLTHRLAGKPLTGRRIVTVVLAFLANALLSWILGGLISGLGINASLLQDILFNMALVGILPMLTWLILLPNTRTAPNPQAQSLPPLAPVKEPPKAPSHSEAPIHFEGSSGEPPLLISPQDLILVEAADNYCKFHYLHQGQPRNKLLRFTLREAEEALAGIPGFHRCHRSFLVNASHVSEVLGNSQAHRLQLRHLAEQVPVSRNFDISVLRDHTSPPAP